MVKEDRKAPLRSLKTPFMALALVAIPLAFGSTGALAGCGGETTAMGDECFDYSSFKGDTPAATFSKDVLPIFRQSCGISSSCHGSQSPTDAAQHYLGPSKSDPDPSAADIKVILDGIVGATSQEEKDMPVVSPGAPEKSFLMYKLDGVKCATLTCGDMCFAQMPQGNTPLSADQRDLIRRWIKQGAKND